MWLNDEIFYQESFLSDTELSELDELIVNYTADINEIKDNAIASGQGGYFTLQVRDELLAQISDKILDLLNDEDFKFSQFYPRTELQFIFPGSDQQVHIDGDGSGKDVRHGIVVYISDPSSYSGGEIFYPEYDIEIKPARGSIAVHSGYVQHGVRLVEENPRFVLVAFTGFAD